MKYQLHLYDDGTNLYGENRQVTLHIYGPYLHGEHPQREVRGPIDVIAEIVLKFLLLDDGDRGVSQG